MSRKRCSLSLAPGHRSHSTPATPLCPPPGHRVRLRMIVARIPDDASSIRIQDVSITLGPRTCPTFLPVDSPTPCVDRPSDRGNRAVYHYFSKSGRGGDGGEDRFSEFRQQISIPGGFLNLFQIVVNIRYVETGVSIPAISTIILVYFR